MKTVLRSRLSVLGCLVPALAVLFAGPARAESREPTGSRLLKGTRAAENGLQVILLTIGQGGYVWEKFGHNALWFRDSARGIDVAYNWGIFDFNQPRFLQRFLTGDTRYWVEGYPGQALVDFYRESDRTITAQRLAFTPEQAERALRYAQWNAREENKYYRYDYFRDNCSTRVRDVIDYALGGAIRAQTTGTRVKRTYRSESVRLVNDMKLTQFGIFTALGQPADRPLSVWETMFIPMAMRDAFRLLKTGGGRGDPLVAQERVLYESRRYRERPNAPVLWLPYALVGLLLAAEFLAVGTAGRRLPTIDAIFRIEVAVWSLLAGIMGLALLLAWTSTAHVFWYRNENLLLANPLALFLALLAPLSIWRPRFARPAAVLALVIAALGVAALALKPVPGFTQHNVPLALLFVPAHVAIAVGLLGQSRRGSG